MKRIISRFVLPVILFAFIHLDVAAFPFCSGGRNNRYHLVEYYICENEEFVKHNVRHMSRDGLINVMNVEYNELEGYQFVGFIITSMEFHTLKELREAWFSNAFGENYTIQSSYYIDSTTNCYPLYFNEEEMQTFIASDAADIDLIYIENKMDGTIENHHIKCKWNDSIIDLLPKMQAYDGYEIEYFNPYFEDRFFDATSRISFMDINGARQMVIEARYKKVEVNEKQ